MKKLLILSLFLILLMTGCASTVTSIPKDKINKIHRVAVVSAFPDNLHFTGIGTTIFNNVYKERSITDWELNKYIENSISSHLKKNNNIEFVEINFDREKIKDIYKSRKSFPPELYSAKPIASYLQEIAKSKDIDTVIIVAEDQIRGYGTDMYVYGATLFNYNELGIEMNTAIYFSAGMLIVDLQTMEPIAKQIVYSEKNVDRSYWNPNPDKLTNEQFKFIKDNIFETLDTGIPTALNKFGIKASTKLNFSASSIEIEDKRTNLTKRDLNIPFMSLPGMSDSINPELTDTHRKIITEEIQKHLSQNGNKYKIIVQIEEGKKVFEATMVSEQEEALFTIKLLVDDGTHTPYYLTSKGQGKKQIARFDADGSHIETIYQEMIKTAVTQAIETIHPTK